MQQVLHSFRDDMNTTIVVILILINLNLGRRLPMHYFEQVQLAASVNITLKMSTVQPDWADAPASAFCSG